METVGADRPTRARKPQPHLEPGEQLKALPEFEQLDNRHRPDQELWVAAMRVLAGAGLETKKRDVPSRRP